MDCDYKNKIMTNKHWINNIDVQQEEKWLVSQAGVSPKLMKQHENNLISTDDVNTRS